MPFARGKSALHETDMPPTDGYTSPDEIPQTYWWEDPRFDRDTMRLVAACDKKSVVLEGDEIHAYKFAENEWRTPGTKVEIVKVKGVSFYRENLKLALKAKSTRAALVKDSGNKYDPNAIKVEVGDQNHQYHIGHLPMEYLNTIELARSEGLILRWGFYRDMPFANIAILIKTQEPFSPSSSPLISKS